MTIRCKLGPLLEQIESPIEQLTADGAYDGEPTYQTIATHDVAIAIVIPPRDRGGPLQVTHAAF